MLERYAEFEGLLASTQAALVMLGMGMTLAVRDFTAVLAKPRSLAVGLTWQLLLAPALTFLLTRMMPMDGGIAVGLILISVMPGGPIANVFTYLARGNLALSITLTTLATFAALPCAPLLLNGLAGGLVPPDVTMPVGAIMLDTLAFVVTPLVVGMAASRWRPAAANVLSPWLVRAGVLVLAAMVVGSLGSGRIEPLSYGWKTPLAIILLCLTFQNASMLPFLVFRWPVADQTAVGVGVTIRNVNLALLLAARLFPASAGDSLGGGVLYSVLFWGAVSLVVCVPTIYVQRRALEAERQRILSAEVSLPT